MINPSNTDEKLYEQVSNHLKQRIRNEEFEGGRLPAFKSLAEAYDVSMITIKNAMQILCEEQMVISRVGRGTFVNPDWRNHVKKEKQPEPGQHPHSIGLLIRDIEGPYFSGTYRGISQFAANMNVNLMLSISQDELSKEEDILKMMMEKKANGIIITSPRKSLYGIETFEVLKEKKFPIVFVHDMYNNPFHTVDTDNYAGARLAAEYLVRRGGRKFAAVVGEIGYKTDDDRLNGFRDGLSAEGVDVKNDFLAYRYSFGTEATAFDEGYKIGKSLSVKGTGIDSILLFNDMIAMGFQKAVLEKGIRIPDDLAVIGFDDIERCSEARVPLTTVRVPREQIGKIAMEILIEAIKNPDMPTQSVILKPELVVRESA